VAWGRLHDAKVNSFPRSFNNLEILLDMDTNYKRKETEMTREKKDRSELETSLMIFVKAING